MEKQIINFLVIGTIIVTQPSFGSVNTDNESLFNSKWESEQTISVGSCVGKTNDHYRISVRKVTQGVNSSILATFTSGSGLKKMFLYPDNSGGYYVDIIFRDTDGVISGKINFDTGKFQFGEKKVQSFDLNCHVKEALLSSSRKIAG